MAELLVRVKDNRRADDPNDLAYRSGDIVTIQPDGHQWGTQEGPPDFTVVKVPGIPAARMTQYIEALVVQVEGPPGEFSPFPVLRRRHQFDRRLLSLLDQAQYDLGRLSCSEETALRTLVTKATRTTEWDAGKTRF